MPISNKIPQSFSGAKFHANKYAASQSNSRPNYTGCPWLKQVSNRPKLILSGLLLTVAGVAALILVGGTLIVASCVCLFVGITIIALVIYKSKPERRNVDATTATQKINELITSGVCYSFVAEGEKNRYVFTRMVGRQRHIA